MESSRLKSIAIVILVILNLSLLGLLGWQDVQTWGGQAETAQQLTALYDANQLKLTASVETIREPLSPLLLSRKTDSEQTIARYILGADTASRGMGGGIYDYTSPMGTIHFRSGGFEGTGLAVETVDPVEFSRKFCRTFGYKHLVFDMEDGTGVATAIQYAADVPVEDCGVTLTFDSSVLTAVSGTHVSLEEPTKDTTDLLTGVTALVRFLDYRNASGIVCGEVQGIDCIYELKNNPLRLTPAWRIQTDTYGFLVDCITGEVSRR